MAKPKSKSSEPKSESEPKPAKGRKKGKMTEEKIAVSELNEQTERSVGMAALEVMHGSNMILVMIDQLMEVGTFSPGEGFPSLFEVYPEIGDTVIAAFGALEEAQQQCIWVLDGGHSQGCPDCQAQCDSTPAKAN